MNVFIMCKLCGEIEYRQPYILATMAVTVPDYFIE